MRALQTPNQSPALFGLDAGLESSAGSAAEQRLPTPQVGRPDLSPRRGTRHWKKAMTLACGPSLLHAGRALVTLLLASSLGPAALPLCPRTGLGSGHNTPQPFLVSSLNESAHSMFYF